jgi:anti-sigma B factor antagonist
VLRVAGENDAFTSVLLEHRIAVLLGERPNLVLDLSQVRFLGSSGLPVLLSTHNYAQAGRGQLHIVTGAHRVVTRVLGITALDRSCTCTDPNGAIASLPPPALDQPRRPGN